MLTVMQGYFGADGAKVKETGVVNLIAPIVLADLKKGGSEVI